MAQVLKAVGGAVGDAVDKIQEVTGLGKDEPKKEQRDDLPQEDQDQDQAPAGIDAASAGPEFTTTSKESDPSSGEEVVTTTQDDVGPLPEAEEDTQPAEPAEPAEPSKQADTKAIAAAEPSPSATQPADSDSSPSESPAPTTMNQLRNMGGGSMALPRTSKKWKQDHSSWYPDAAGVHHPPGFFIHKRRHPAAL